MTPYLPQHSNWSGLDEVRGVIGPVRTPRIAWCTSFTPPGNLVTSDRRFHRVARMPSSTRFDPMANSNARSSIRRAMSPRLRLSPTRPSLLEPCSAITLARQRYGFVGASASSPDRFMFGIAPGANRNTVAFVVFTLRFSNGYDDRVPLSSVSFIKRKIALPSAA